jgi:hypothetical protein
MPETESVMSEDVTFSQLTGESLTWGNGRAGSIPICDDSRFIVGQVSGRVKRKGHLRVSRQTSEGGHTSPPISFGHSPLSLGRPDKKDIPCPAAQLSIMRIFYLRAVAELVSILVNPFRILVVQMQSLETKLRQSAETRDPFAAKM